MEIWEPDPKACLLNWSAVSLQFLHKHVPEGLALLERRVGETSALGGSLYYRSNNFFLSILRGRSYRLIYDKYVRRSR